jgi:hypothetical protein
MPAFDPMSVPLLLSTKDIAGKGNPSEYQEYLLKSILEAGFDWDDLPVDLRAMYALDYYMFNVYNGGHAQFIGNAFAFYSAGPIRMLDWAEEAAQRFGMTETVATIAKARAWIVANPDEALRQTGATGGCADALEPLDAALYCADTLPEAEWLAVLAPLPPEVAEEIARGQFYRHHKSPLTFPASVHVNFEMVALLTRYPQKVVPEGEVEYAIGTLVRGLPGAPDNLISKLFVGMRLPTILQCAALDVLEASCYWKGGEASDGLELYVFNQRSDGIVCSAMICGKSRYLLITQGRDDTVIVEETTGSPMSLSKILYLKERFAGNLWERIRRFFDPLEKRRRQFRAAIARSDARNALRPIDQIGSGHLSSGQNIFSLMQSLYLPEALTLYLYERREFHFQSFRLLRWSERQLSMDWVLTTMRNEPIQVLAKADGVMLRLAGVDSVTRYESAELRAVRAKLAV